MQTWIERGRIGWAGGEDLDEHALLAKLLGDVRGGRARDLDPGLGEEGAG